VKIAILTTTRPLRERIQEIGREVEMLSPKKCAALAEQYDLILLGSRASDDFFERIRSSLPRRVLDKFRMYPRSFFDRFKRHGALPSEYDDRDEGWKEILQSNGIGFVTQARIVNGDFTAADRAFHWTHLDDFIRDDRVTIVK
jgi:hypothetical protein